MTAFAMSNEALTECCYIHDLGNTTGEMEEANRIPISVLLPENFAHSLSLSVDKRTPVLDLLVYVASLFRFNPADYVLGYVDPVNDTEFRILRPNSCVGTAGSSVLRIAHKKQVMSTLTEEGACLRYAYSNRHKPISAKRFTIPADISRDVHVNVLLPDGRNVLVSQPEDTTLGQLFLRVCDKYSLDPNRYTLQPAESLSNDIIELACSSSRLASWKNHTFHMLPALKACNLAESENSVDRMSQIAEFQFRQKEKPRSSELPNAAVKALAAGTMMPDVTAGLGLNEPTCRSFSETKVCVKPIFGKPKKAFSTVDRLHNNGYHKSSLQGSFHGKVYYPERQNTLELVSAKSAKKQRAPLPPGLSASHRERIGPGNVGKYSLQFLSNGPCRDGRVHSACSTLDDISEDFRQAIQLGATMPPGRCDKAAQTLDFVRAKPFLISQEIQTPDELLHADDRFEFSQRRTSVEKSSRPRQQQLPLHHLTTIIKDYDEKCRHVVPLAKQSLQLFPSKIFNESSTQCDDSPQIKPRKKHFLHKIQGKGSSQPRRCQNIAAIINDQEQLLQTKEPNRLVKGEPVQLEVTEKTTTVECTVTVMAEGKSLSAVKKPLSAPAAGQDVLGPRPYCKKLEFRKLHSEDAAEVADSTQTT